MTKLHTVGLKEVEGVEIISLLDNTVDFISSVTHKHAHPFGQWARERYGQQWTSNHAEFPLAEHGFSMLVRVFSEKKTESVLFDAGGSSETVCINAKRMGINLSEVGCIVLSHGHYDHFGGLLSAIKAVGKTNLPIIVHGDMLKPRGTAYPDGTIRKYTEFPTRAQLGSNCIISTKEPSLVAKGMICVTGEIPRQTSFEKGLSRHCVFVNNAWQPDPWIMDDRAIVINVKGKGLVIASGCAHAGIINTTIYSRRITGVSDVYAVLGGFHLAGKENESKIPQTIDEFKQIEPRLVAPSHCTGWRAMKAFGDALPEAFVWNCVGNLYEIRIDG